MKLLIKNGQTLLYENGRFVIDEKDIAVEGSRIRAVADPGEIRGSFDKILDASSMLVMPGLINAHTHAYMSLFRNYADDLDFFDWLEKVQKVEDCMTVQDSYWTTMLSIIEMIRTGTTSFVDMHMHGSLGTLTGPDSACSGAANESGIRAFLSRGLVGTAGEEGAVRRINAFFADMQLFAGVDRLRYLLGPHAPYSCAQSLLREVREEGLKRQMRATIHLCESEAEIANMAREYQGRTPIQYADDAGLFDIPVIAAHCVNVTGEDIRILKEHGVSVAINPRSNMKLGNGFAPADVFLEEGLNICLGTDGSGSNNTQNMFQEMNIAALVYKGKEKRSKCVDAQDVLRFATVGGAKALGMEGELGELREGALADIILLDLAAAQFVPRNDLVSALVYSANGSEVRTVIVNGEVLMEDRKLLTIDEQTVFGQCEAIAKRLHMHDEI